MSGAKDIQLSSRSLACLASERGASFTFALILLLICVVISIVVFVSVNAVAGDMAGSGAKDRQYYSVTSAAQLVKDSLGEDGLTLEFVDERVGVAANARVSDEVADGAWGKVKLVKAPEALEQLSDPLVSISYYPLYGEMVEVSEGGAAELDVTDFEEPFTCDKWADAVTANVDSDGRNYLKVTYVVEPDFADESLPDSDYKVLVDGRLRDDWTLELDFHSDTGNAAGQFHLSMVLAADVESTVDRKESLKETTVEGGVGNQLEVTETRTTTVTWKMQRLVPGEGFDD